MDTTTTRARNVPGGFSITDPEGLHSLLDTIPARVAHLDDKRRYRFVNTAYALAVGLPAAEIIGRTATQIMGPARARRMRPLALAALEGRVTQMQAWSKYPVAGWGYVETLYAPVCRSDGRIDGYFVMVRDLTALKQREEELAARTAHLEAIISSVADGVSIADAEGRMVLCNQGFLDMFDCPSELDRPGTAHDAVDGRRLTPKIFYPHEVPTDAPSRKAVRQMARVREGGLVSEAVRVSGRHLNLRRRHMADGTYVSTYTDVTAQVEAEAALKLQHDAMREAQQLGTIAALLAGVAHELKNPLSVVATHATLLGEEAAGTPLATRAEAIQAAVQKCGRVVDSLLASVRNRSPKREAVRVEDSLAAAQDLVAHRLQATGATIIAEIPADLPSLHADPGQLIHLLANLLANAAAALEGTGRSPRILMAAVAEENTMVLRVADNGPGIAPALRERVFQPFFTTKPEGSGVGLALCRTIVQDHGGSITAEDTPGGGATLVVRLPLTMP